MRRTVTKLKANVRVFIIALIFMMITQIIMGVVLISMSNKQLREQINARMLDTANAAASQIDGDAVKRLTEEDRQSAGYNKALITLRLFQQNIKLDYIYLVKIDEGDKFSFLIDPDTERPGQYGEPIKTTDAMINAANGRADVDKEAYRDEWGIFYSAYSPVWDSNGDVAALVGVDFNADKYDEELNQHKAVVVIISMIATTIIIGVVIVMHTFALEGEKAAYRKELDETLKREKVQEQELGSVRQLAYTDPLTGVKSKRAYLEAIERLDREISAGSSAGFGVIVFDLNGLKNINDTLGHEEGDRYIQAGSALICDIFSHSPVFRIGGDEFVVLLEGKDYESGEKLLSEFNKKIEENLHSGKVVVSTGLDEFDPRFDISFSAVFERADKKMYERKCYLKTIAV